MLLALIAGGSGVSAAAIAAYADLRRNTRKATKELEGNGNGTMLQMVTETFKSTGRIEERLDSLEGRVDGLEDVAPKRF